MVDIHRIADEADVIIDGYAFSKFEGEAMGTVFFRAEEF